MSQLLCEGRENSKLLGFIEIFGLSGHVGAPGSRGQGHEHIKLVWIVPQFVLAVAFVWLATKCVNSDSWHLIYINFSLVLCSSVSEFFVSVFIHQLLTFFRVLWTFHSLCKNYNFFWAQGPLVFGAFESRNKSLGWNKVPIKSEFIYYLKIIFH